MKISDAVVACLDVGREQGWAILDPLTNEWTWGSSYEEFCQHLSRFLIVKRSILLGFEAAGFLPQVNDIQRLFRARNGEVANGQSRPWSACAGRSATWRALPLVPKLLSDLRNAAPKNISGHLALTEQDNSVRLLIWEAFVTSAPNGFVAPKVPFEMVNASPHVWDAAMAIKEFRNQIMTQQIVSNVVDEVSISLFGSALLATMWSSDCNLASTQPHVIRAYKPAA